MSQITPSTDLVGLAQPAAAQPATADPATGGRRRTRDERGMTTAEYAVGTIAAASFAGILIKILTDPQIRATLLELLMTILRHFMQIPAV